MTALLKQAYEHWHYVAPLLTAPENDDDYDALVQFLDELLDEVGDDEGHPLASLAARIGDLIEAYDEEHHPLPPVSGTEALRYLMQEHNLSQTDLAEIGPQSVVSEILNGKRKLNLRQVVALSERFRLPVEVFLSA